MTHTPLFAAFSPKFVRAARLVGLVSALVVGGCASRPRQHRAAWARKPAAGRPATCPDHPVDVWGDGTPGPNDLRCSYEGTAGGQLIQLRGIVSEAAEGQALGQGLEKQRVEVLRVKDGVPTGDPLGTATTDAQGRFSLGVVLRPGTYVVRVITVGPGSQPVERWVEIASGTRSVPDVDLVVPH